MIKAENVNYIYQQGMPFERQALYDVNIEIEDGSLVALIGHTGSGKSTLIQHFNALVKPTSGKIIINGIDVTAPKADLRLVRKTVGLVFQYPEHQLFEETVYKDIAFGPKNMGFSDEEIDKMMKEAEANKEAVKKAIENVVTFSNQEESISWKEFLELDIIGDKKKRLKVYDLFHLGYGNAKTLFKRLNMVGISREMIEKELENEGYSD